MLLSVFSPHEIEIGDIDHTQNFQKLVPIGLNSENSPDLPVSNNIINSDTHSVNPFPAVDSSEPCMSADGRTQQEEKCNYDFPSILLANMQGFGKPGKKTDKTSHLDLVVDKNQIDIGVFSETWATDSIINNLELEFNQFSKYHFVRQNCLKPSGGLSIFVNSIIPSNKLEIKVPDHLEVLYVSVRPKKLPRLVSNIVLCAVYYPGSTSEYAPPQDDLISHLIESIHSLQNKYSNPLIVLLGDFNDLKLTGLCKSCKLKQVVKVPTRGDVTLDLILTNTDNHFYKEPTSLAGIGKSDHLCVLFVPKLHIKNVNVKKKIPIRRFKQSAILEFGAWITRFDWSVLFQIKDVNQKVLYFSAITWAMVELLFPLQTITVSDSDKVWMTSKIKGLIKQRQKAHFLNDVEQRKLLAKKIRDEIIKAKENYNAKKAHLFHMSNSKEWYKHVSHIIGNKKRNLTLINIPEVAYKPIGEQISIINEHFAKICKLYPPLAKDQINLSEINNNKDPIKVLSEFDTYKLLLKYSKKSLGPGDLPQRIIKEFAPELSTPFCDIINCALLSSIFPDAYKKAEIVPIPKVNPPRSLSELRPISKTPIGGKMIEKVIMQELEKDIKDKLDQTQYGNCKGSSTTHYLVNLTDQIFKSADKGQATTAITIDYSKAFDFVDHNILIQKLVHLGIRPCIVKILSSFLSNRSHCTNIGGDRSEYLFITCGVPQGTVLGPKLFVILINGDNDILLSCFKFVDDKTLAHSYFGNHTVFIQEQLNREFEATKTNKMIINENKSNVINFNFSKFNTEPQDLKLNGKLLPPVEKIKLLGVYITKDLTWTANTENICSKVYQRLFWINKLKSYGLQKEELINAWLSMLRPVAEYAAPLWHSGLSDGENNKIEMLQKNALSIILGTEYIDHKRYYKYNEEIVSYDGALQKLGLTTLNERRAALTKNFAIGTASNVKHSTMFTKNQSIGIPTRNRPTLEVPFCRTERYYKSAVPVMTRMLNDVFANKQKKN